MPVLILGARSDIAMALAHRFARAGHPLQLAARNAATLEAAKTDLELRYRTAVTLHELDALAPPDALADTIDSLPELPGIAICAIGLMGDQDKNEIDPEAALQVMRSTYEGPAMLMAHLANRMAARGSGALIGISSVAGDRGRAANYIYGSAKAGFTAYLSGLRNRLAGQGVRVLTVLPGFVATKMTEGMDLPEKLTAAPEEVAEAVFRAHSRGRDIIYVRRIWWLVMLIIRNIPEPIFKKLSI